MSDFYTVLRQSIVDRGLRSPAAREEVYSQARTAMIRQLWSYDPPLAEDEIDARIGAFDKTVERIEGDLVTVFAEAPPRPPAGARGRLPAIARPAPIIEGYDQDADYATPRSRNRTERPPASRVDEDARRRRDAEDEEAMEIGRFARRLAPDPLAERSAAIEQALREEEEDRNARDERTAHDDPPPDHEDEDYREEPFDRHEDERPAWRGRHDVDHGDDDDHAPHRDEVDDTHDEAARPPPARRPTVPLRSTWSGLSERGQVLALVGVIAALGIVLIVVGAYIVMSLMSGPRPGGQVEVPVQPGGVATGSPAAAIAIAGEAADVLQSFTLFDGHDPTVFSSAPDNPIRFDRDAGGTGFARISSSTSDAGVRVNIGPGLAGRLSGHPVRIVIAVRSAKENGAANLRFAYQSGVALSHWQAVNLTADVAAYGLIWRVPSMRTDPTGDYLLIEPGIPGDGTAAEIQSIRLDLLAKEPG